MIADSKVYRYFRKLIYYFRSIFLLLFQFKNPVFILRLFLGFAPDGIKQVQLRNTGLKFVVRNPMDVWSIKETFLDRFYEKYGFEIDNGWIIMDIGGGVGDFALFASTGFDSNFVHAFEPTLESLKLLKKNLSINGISNVKAYSYAIEETTGNLILDSSGDDPLQFQNQEYSNGVSQTLSVPSYSLNRAFDKLSLQRCDLLKLDCEGSEFAILLTAPEEVLSKIQRIVLEYHDGVTANHHDDLVEYLTSNGFEVETFPNYVHSHLGYIRAIRSNLV